VDLHQVLSQVFKKLVHVISSLGADPNNTDPHFPCPQLMFPPDPLLKLVIALVPEHKNLFSVTVNKRILNPLHFNIIKRLFISHIIHNHNGLRPVVIRLGDVVESLLPGSVPQLEFDELFVEVEGSELVEKILESKVDANGGKVGLVEFVVSETF
jgi:hypothetical protein